VEHELFQTTFGSLRGGAVPDKGSVLDSIEAQLPLGGILEQVEGFNTFDAELNATPLEYLANALRRVAGPDGEVPWYTGFATLRMDPSAFLAMRRPRFLEQLRCI
jgi:hypothetical protein